MAGRNFHKKRWGNQLYYFMRLSHQFVNKITRKEIQNCPYMFFVLSTSLAWRLNNSLSMCLWYCMLYSFHFTAGVFQITFLYSFRGVGAMEIVAMDMKVRSIVLSIVKCWIVLGNGYCPFHVSIHFYLNLIPHSFWTLIP